MRVSLTGANFPAQLSMQDAGEGRVGAFPSHYRQVNSPDQGNSVRTFGS
jgi:hypothetical protein